MKLYLFPAGRAVSMLSLKGHLGIQCEVQHLDFTSGKQRKASYAENSNMKMPTFEDGDFVLWDAVSKSKR